MFLHKAIKITHTISAFKFKLKNPTVFQTARLYLKYTDRLKCSERYRKIYGTDKDKKQRND